MRSRSLAAAGAALAAIAAGAAGASPNGTAAQDTCVPKNDVEAIVDDSGSMILTDGERLRVRAMELFIDNPVNEKRMLGAIEFGSTAVPVFARDTISGHRASMKSALNAAIMGNNDLTDYNDAFALAATHNPSATARIFLTDGQHSNEDMSPYTNGHAGGPPVYVIGLGIFGNADAVLRQIADDTHGRYIQVDNASELQPAMFELNAEIDCLSTPVRRKATFSQAGQAQKVAVRMPDGVSAANVGSTWDSSDDSFDITNIRVLRNGRTVARPSRVRKLRVTKRRGATFVTVRISRLVRGKLVFNLKARRLSSGGSATVTTQIVRARRR
jgi:hypothetical protein